MTNDDERQQWLADLRWAASRAAGVVKYEPLPYEAQKELDKQMKKHAAVAIRAITIDREPTWMDMMTYWHYGQDIFSHRRHRVYTPGNPMRRRRR